MGDERKRDGIAEILASGRAPGFRVAGGTRKPTQLGYNPTAYDGSYVSPKRRLIAQQVDHEKRYGRKGNVRLAGGCPMSVWKTKMTETGGDIAEVKRQLADEGFIDKSV